MNVAASLSLAVSLERSARSNTYGQDARTTLCAAIQLARGHPVAAGPNVLAGTRVGRS